MESYHFNRTLFVRNDDNAFKIAVMFSHYSKIEDSTQAFLFFANNDIVKGKVNFLAFAEMFNETLEYNNKWISELDRIKDEFDWKFHRSKLITRFLMLKPVNADDLYAALKKDNPREANSIGNTSILWNNAITLAQRDFYSNKNTSKAWELWEILQKYKNGSIDEIKGNDSHLKELGKIIKYRKEDQFYKDYRESLNDKPEILKEIDIIEKELETIFFKDKLSKELPIISTIRKKLKI